MKINRKDEPTDYATIDLTKQGPKIVEEVETYEEEDIWGYVPDELCRHDEEPEK